MTNHRSTLASHSDYFPGIATALDRAGLARPTLVIDRQRLLRNTDVLCAHLGDRYAYRVVAKSLPALALLEEIMGRAQTERLMVFHQPFLNLIARQLPKCDVLMGKPMPVAAADRFYRHHSGAFDPSRQLQWLIDSPQRLQQYGELARGQNVSMRVNFEIDVGLHRGGIANDAELALALDLVDREPLLQFCGLMGYDPHVVKIPEVLGGPTAAFASAQKRYRAFATLVQDRLGSLENLTLNAAGSPTYQLYDGKQVANELSAGSALVKPTDFDLPTLADHEAAAFIATPVLKALDAAKVPGIEKLSKLQSWLDSSRQRAFFIYGGYWKALPEHPAGLSYNSLYGRSTNQEMLNGSASIDLEQDDWVFLRPTQSEHVFLQFGDIAVYDQGAITDTWPVFTQGD